MTSLSEEAQRIAEANPLNWPKPGVPTKMPLPGTKGAEKSDIPTGVAGRPPTDQEITEANARILHELDVLLANKNAGYKRNLQRHGLRGIIIRMSDKMMRLENLVLGQGEEMVSERVQDTLMDLAGYSIKALALDSLGDLTLEGEWAQQNGVLYGQMSIDDCIAVIDTQE